VYKVAFDKDAEKEFLRLEKSAQELISKKLLDLRGGKHKGKYRKRVGDYRIIYLRENELVLITIIRVAHRREAY